jgi:hypothetical protein
LKFAALHARRTHPTSHVMLGGKERAARMNSDTDILVLQILEQSGAIAKCQTCFGVMLDQEDGDAEDMAYGMATNAWKRGERGFRNMDREEVMGLVKSALTRESAPEFAGSKDALGAHFQDQLVDFPSLCYSGVSESAAVSRTSVYSDGSGAITRNVIT